MSGGPTSRTLSVAACLSIAAASGVTAQVPEPTPSDPRAVVERIDGGSSTLTGSLTWIDRDGPALRINPGDSSPTVELQLDQIASIRVEGNREPAIANDQPRLELRNGDLLVGELLDLDDRSASIRRADDQLRLERRRLRTFVAKPDAEGLTELLRQAAEEPPTTEDLLFAVGGSGALRRLTVRVLGLREGSLRLRFGGEDRDLPLDRCAALVFGSDLGLQVETPERPYLRVELIDGSRITGRAKAGADGGLVLTPPGSSEVSIAATEVDRIRVFSSRLVRLHDRDPISADRRAAFDELPEWTRDRTALGPSLFLEGRPRSRGFCLRPFTRLDFEFPEGHFDTFETELGIDSRSTGPADAIARIRFDGEVVGEWRLRRGGRTIEVRLPLGSASTWSLEVDFGASLDLGDHCLFVDPRLKRGS